MLELKERCWEIAVAGTYVFRPWAGFHETVVWYSNKGEREREREREREIQRHRLHFRIHNVWHCCETRTKGEIQRHRCYFPHPQRPISNIVLQKILNLSVVQIVACTAINSAVSCMTRLRNNREISIALDSTRGLWFLRWRMFTHGVTGLEMCTDSTVCEYIPRIHGISQIVVAEWESARSVLLVYWMTYV